jgi:hypothetical protein
LLFRIVFVIRCHGRASEASVHVYGCGTVHFRENLVRVQIDKTRRSIDCSDTRKDLVLLREFQPSFSELPEVEFHEGLPDVSRFDGRQRVLLIIDDLMNEADQNVCNLFTKLSHHRSVSVVFITQNLYHRNGFVRTMNVNTHYIVLFKNPRDANQVTTLARQMYPGKSKFVVEAFKDATKNPYGYLLIDLKLETHERYRIRTNIFPVYVSKV